MSISESIYNIIGFLEDNGYHGVVMHEAIQAISQQKYDTALELITSEFSDSDGNELPESIVQTVLEHIKGE